MAPVHVIDLEGVTLNFLEGDIVHAHVKDGRTGSVADVKEMFVAIPPGTQGCKALLMVSVGLGAR
jgi:hypothetical protein